MEPLQSEQIGQRGQKPARCALTGRPLTPGDVYFRVNGHKLGVRVHAWLRLTADEKAAMKAEWAKSLTAAAEASSSAGTSTLDYTAMTVDALKTLAADRGLDLGSAKTKDAIIQAIHLADVAAKISQSGGDAPLDLANMEAN